MNTNTTPQTIPATIVLTQLDAQTVLATVTPEAGPVRTFRAANDLGLITSLDRKMRRAGIVREAYASEAGTLVAAGWVLA